MGVGQTRRREELPARRAQPPQPRALAAAEAPGRTPAPRPAAYVEGAPSAPSPILDRPTAPPPIDGSLAGAPGWAGRPPPTGTTEPSPWGAPSSRGIGAGVAPPRPASATPRPSATGEILAGSLDINNRMSSRDYNATINMPPAERRTSGYFADREREAAREVQTLDQEIAREEARQPPNQARLTELRQLRNLAEGVRALHQSLRDANTSDRTGDAGEVLTRVAELEAQLAAMSPDTLGATQHREMQLHLRELSDIIDGYDEMRSRGHAGHLDNFVLTTHRRLQQIETGQRRRSTETNSVAGALQTFRNDDADQVVFRGRFQALNQRLEAGEFRNRAEFEAAMLAAVPSTSPRFQEGVRRLAQARWLSHQATTHTDLATERLSRALHATQSAFTELQSAEADLGQSQQSIQLGQHALSQRDAGAAREAVTAAGDLRAQADQHLAEYDRLIRQGGRENQLARRHLVVAAAYLRASNATLDLVEAGGYGASVSGEAAAVRSHNDGLRARIDRVAQGSIELSTQQRSLQAARQRLSEWSSGLGSAVQSVEAGVSLAEMENTVDAQVGEGANRAHELIAMTLDGVPLSERTRAFLRDPDSVNPDDVADIREELTEVFRTRPELANRVAGHVLELRADFQQRREALVQQFGEGSPQVAAMDTIEHGYLQSWMRRDQPVFEALFRASTSSAEAATAVGRLESWFSASRARYSRVMLSDPQRSQEAASQFHDWMVQQQGLGDAYREKVAQYGEPVGRTPMTLHLEESGRLVSFNAYVFRDGDQYKAFNPLDGRIYTGATQADALRNLAADAHLGQGTLRYQQGGALQESRSQPPPEGSLAMDLGMGVVGGVGAVLFFAPEPTTLTKWGGGAMMAASATYFMGKGSIAMYDLVQHETFGNNAQTWGAALDIASGALVFLRGAGALGSLARTESALATRLAAIGNTALTGAEYTAMAGGVALASHSLAQVYNDPNLSDREKVNAAAQTVVAFGIPIGVVGAASRLSRAQSGRQLTRAHGEYVGRLQQARVLAQRLAASDNPQVRAQLRRSLDDVIAQARTAYDSPAMRARPDLRQNGLAAIEGLEQIRRGLPEAPALPPAARPTAPSGSRGAGAPVDRRVLRDPAMPEALRGRLEGLADRATHGAPEHNQRLQALRGQRERLALRIREAERLDQPEQAGRLRQQMEGLDSQITRAELERSHQMRQDRTRFEQESSGYRQLTEARPADGTTPTDGDGGRYDLMARPRRPPPEVDGQRGYFEGRRIREDGRISGRRFAGQTRAAGLAEAQRLGIRVVENADAFLVGQFGAEAPAAAFDASSGTIYLRRGASQYEFFHEFAHARQWKELGRDAYLAQTRFQRELFVFNEVMSNSSQFNRYEWEHARNYIERLAERYGQPVPFERD